MVYQDNVIITLNSANASLVNSTLKSSVSFNFLGLLKEEDDIVRSYISVINAQIPMSFYIITSSNNKLVFINPATGGDITDLYVPIGNYNAYTLSASLMSAFLVYGLSVVVSVSPQTGLMSFLSNSTPPVIFYPYQLGDTIFLALLRSLVYYLMLLTLCLLPVHIRLIFWARKR